MDGQNRGFGVADRPQDKSRRMISRGILLATAFVVPMTRKPAFWNIDRVPTKAMVVSIRPGGSTG